MFFWIERQLRAKHDYHAHLEDSFLVLMVAMHSPSERQGMVNPRKAYPEVPFIAHRAGEAPILRSACFESQGDETLQGELRALEAAIRRLLEEVCDGWR